jgi:hypothetical protein
MISWIIISSIIFSSRSLCTFHVPIGGISGSGLTLSSHFKQSLLLENAFDLGCYIPYTRFEPHPHKPWLNQHLHWYNWWDMKRTRVGSDMMNQGVYLSSVDKFYTFKCQNRYRIFYWYRILTILRIQVLPGSYLTQPTLVPSMSETTGLRYNWPSSLINQAWFISDIRPTLVPSMVWMKCQNVQNNVFCLFLRGSPNIVRLSVCLSVCPYSSSMFIISATHELVS